VKLTDVESCLTANRFPRLTCSTPSTCPRHAAQDSPRQSHTKRQGAGRTLYRRRPRFRLSIPDTPREWVIDDHGIPAVKIPPGRLLVMGDNRNNSNDCRFWGLLERQRVMGKAWFIFWPLNRMRCIR